MTLDTFQVFEQDLSDSALAEYLNADAIAVDTETMGLIPQRDRLCLVQLCDPDSHVSAIRIGLGQTAAPNLKQLLESPNSTKIFHFARFDLATLQYHLDIQTHPFFCTKLTSKLARTYSPRHGLKEIVSELEGVDLDKSAQSSDWGNVASLSTEQLAYAANDVKYLIPMRQKLIAMLKREGRWELAQECLACLSTMVKLDLMRYSSSVFEH
ncbi:MAG: ribonuclease H-like domain-containing protein [Cyanobacteria bacterium P01_F01_bin.150]